MENRELTETSKGMLYGDILENLFSKCSTCPIRHQCAIHEKAIAESKEKVQKFSKETYERRVEKPNDLDWNRQLDKEVREFSIAIWKAFDAELQGRDCDYEKKEIIGSLSRLQNEYDLRKWKVFELVRSHLRQVVLNFRAFKMSASEPMITWKYTEEGSKIPIINPILNYQLQSTAATERLIRTLDLITKEDQAISNFITSGKRLWEDYLQKVPHAEVIDIKTEEQIRKFEEEELRKSKSEDDGNK